MSSVFEIKGDIKEVYDDVVYRTKDFLATYDQRLAKMPEYKDFEDLNHASIYKVYNECLALQDDVVDVLVRVELVFNQMNDVIHDDLKGDSTYDSRHVRSVKEWIINKSKVLERYKYVLLEVRRLVSDRLKLLQSSMFKMGW